MPTLRLVGVGVGQPAHLVVEGQLACISRTGHPSRVRSRSTLPLASSIEPCTQ